MRHILVLRASPVIAAKTTDHTVNVILVTGSLGDGAGGLASAVRAWALALAEAGHTVTIFCLRLNRVLGPNKAPSHPAITLVEIRCLMEPTTRFVLAPSLRRLLQRQCEMEKVDVIHANGIWLPGTRASAHIARAQHIPLVVSPHGHLQQWAMAHKSWKKSLAWKLYGHRSVVGASILQAASEDEASALRALELSAPIAIVPNIVDIPDKLVKTGLHEGKTRTALFLSRIHPSKGLVDLMRAWGAVRPQGWRLVVAGGDEVGHLKRVIEVVKELDLINEVEFVGSVPYESRWSWYSKADLFVLPTYSENFGIAVAEALAAGLPTITTRAAPWSILEKEGCGWWIKTGVNPLICAIKVATELSDDTRAAMGARGRALVLEKYSSDFVASQLESIYHWARSGKLPPGYIDTVS